MISWQQKPNGLRMVCQWVKLPFLLILFLITLNCFSYANEIAITFDNLPEATNDLLKKQEQINQRILSDPAYMSPDDYYASGKIVDWSKDSELDINLYINTKTLKFYDRIRKRVIPVTAVMRHIFIHNFYNLQLEKLAKNKRNLSFAAFLSTLL